MILPILERFWPGPGLLPGCRGLSSTRARSCAGGSALRPRRVIVGGWVRGVDVRAAGVDAGKRPAADGLHPGGCAGAVSVVLQYAKRSSAARRFLRAAARLSTQCEGGITQRREPFFIPYNVKL